MHRNAVDRHARRIGLKAESRASAADPRFAIAGARIKSEARAGGPPVQADVFVAKKPDALQPACRCRCGDSQPAHQKQPKTNCGLHSRRQFADRLRWFQGIWNFSASEATSEDRSSRRLKTRHRFYGVG